MDEVTKAFVEILNVYPDEVTDDASLIFDLGVDSLDLVELTAELDERFGIDIPDEKMLDAETVGDVRAAIAFLRTEPKP